MPWSRRSPICCSTSSASSSAHPNFSQISLVGISLGAFLSALFTFVLTGLVIYFFVIVPYNRLSEITKKDDPEVAASTEDLLAEIRDLLKVQAERQQ